MFVPLSLWQEIEGALGTGGGDSYIRILSQEKDSPELLDELETEAAQIIGTEYDLETENRVQEKLDNDRMIRASALEPMEFINKAAPVVPILAFILASWHLLLLHMGSAEGKF